MPYINNKEAEETSSTKFSLIPTANYLAELIDITERKTAKGDDMWSLKFEILDGGQEGRYVFDNMVFSSNPKAKSRIKLITKRLGVPEDFVGELTKDMLLRRQVCIDVDTKEYEGEKKNFIPFAGYYDKDEDRKFQDELAPLKKKMEDDGGDIPF